MSSGFDPYYKWLGIPPKDQPPHHYRLLGIEMYEGDREVIDAAANRLMAFLQEQSAGDEMDAAQKLLNEIAAARLCLLNDGKRSSYDKQLRAKLKPAAPAAKAIPQAKAVQGTAAPQQAKLVKPADAAPQAKKVHKANPPPPPDAPKPLINTGGGSTPTKASTRPTRSARPYQRKKSNALPILVLLGCVLAAAAVLAVVMLSSKPDTQPTTQSSGNGSQPRRPVSTLRIDLGGAARHEVRLHIDSHIQQLPADGPIEFELNEGAHDLTIEREGYSPVQQRIATVKDVITDYKIEWARLKSKDGLDVRRSFQNLNTDKPPVVGSAGSAQPTLVQELPGLLAYWSFDEDLLDRGGRAAHAQLAEPVIRGGLIGGAVTLSPEAMIKVNKPLGGFGMGSGAAVGGWFRWTEGKGPILSGPRWRVVTNGERLVLRSGEMSRPAGAGNVKELQGRWVHLAVHYRKGPKQLQLLINARVAAKLELNSPPGPLTPLQIGAPGGGAIDELAAFSRPFAVDQLKSIVDQAPKEREREPDD
ncbi:MAG: hypothetical protein QGG36_00740 [Pirellulaceae bacterium]|jgi:hypothetical protein|nr:hypothetical protein [Pirellulaceae bacterium]MDP7014302.1 hypothetical protein [Pirellulaceae bacterium]